MIKYCATLSKCKHGPHKLPFSDIAESIKACGTKKSSARPSHKWLKVSAVLKGFMGQAGNVYLKS